MANPNPSPEYTFSPEVVALFPRGVCECAGDTHPACWCQITNVGGPAAVLQGGRRLCTRCMDPIAPFDIMIHPDVDNVITLQRWDEDGLAFIAMNLQLTPEQKATMQAEAQRRCPHYAAAKAAKERAQHPVTKSSEDDVLRSLGILPEAEEVLE